MARSVIFIVENKQFFSDQVFAISKVGTRAFPTSDGIIIMIEMNTKAKPVVPAQVAKALFRLSHVIGMMHERTNDEVS